MKHITVRGVTLNLTQWAAVCGWSIAGLSNRIKVHVESGETEEQAIESLLPTAPTGPRPRAITVGPISATLDEWAAAFGLPREALENASARRGFTGTPAERLSKEVEHRLRSARAKKTVVSDPDRPGRVRALADKGLSHDEIARAEGVSRQRVSQILKESKP